MTRTLKHHKLVQRQFFISDFDDKPISELIDCLNKDTNHLINPRLHVQLNYDGEDDYYISYFRPMTEKEIIEADKKAADAAAKSKKAAQKRLVEIAKKEIEQLKKLSAKYPDEI